WGAGHPSGSCVRLVRLLPYLALVWRLLANTAASVPPCGKGCAYRMCGALKRGAVEPWAGVCQMCGEIDEQSLIGQEMLDRFKPLARGRGLPAAQSNLAAPANLADEQGRADYMETVFRTGLSGALDAISRAEEDEKIDALAGQAIAL